ncbi:hypothetical protein, partial [Acinetobacter baumannii]|uniref:hypothetical protein n=1 Tax=Acinetobacter baumannii TaxID=470 RepID=UPI001C07024B
IQHQSHCTKTILETLEKEDLEEVAIQVIRKKISASTLPNKAIEFKTGGPRASTPHYTGCPLKNENHCFICIVSFMVLITT